VHCHAGYGRTGVVIACYLIYTTNESVDGIISAIRKKRPKCIQKNDQYSFCKKFSEYIRKARTLYNLSIDNSFSKKSIEYYMKYQKDTLYGKELEIFDSIPKLIYKILDRLLELKQKFSIENKKFINSLYMYEEWNHDSEEILTLLKVKSIN
jgi:protein tyrosine phosphatase domain-containing protein 1